MNPAPTAFVFGRHFGMLHAPRADRARDAGVVLCNPLGYDAMCVHRTYRALAERLAAAGLFALRFDYHGTGDSPGEEMDPEAWLDGIDSAIDALRTRVRAVSLAGVRFGATLAALASARRSDIGSAVLWAPVTSGRAYARELRAFARLNRADDERPSVAGYVFDRPTLDAIASVDLYASGVVAPAVLVVARDDLPGDEPAFVEHLAEHGGRARLARAPGYSGMMRDPQDAIVPGETLDTIVRWLETDRRLAERPSEPVRAPSSVLALGDVRETLVRFGDGDRLFGVVSDRDGHSGSPAVLLLNVGANHHVGPSRMYVTLGRTLAARGVVSLRFDVAGLGDSELDDRSVGDRLYSKDSVSDVSAAMTFLESRHGIRSFVLVGLCSGAYLGFHAALEDRRVCGAVLINPQTFDWKDGDSLDLAVRNSRKSSRYYTRAFFRAHVWAKALRGEVHVREVADVLRERVVARAAELRARIARRSESPCAVERAFRTLSDRGVEVLVVFSDTDGGIDRLESHLGPNAYRMRSRKNFRMEIIEGADHTFTGARPRRELLELVSGHVVQRFTSPAAA